MAAASCSRADWLEGKPTADRSASATSINSPSYRGTNSARMTDMPPDQRSYALRLAAEHHAAAKACEAGWQDELERRRRELEGECSRLLERLQHGVHGS